MRYWILVLLPVVLMLGCRDKVTNNDDGGDGGGGGGGGNQSSIPHAPGNLRATVQVGVGVQLQWNDSSSNEQHFHFCHGLASTQLLCDQLPANTTSRFDSVGLVEGLRRYQVSAENDSGRSAVLSLDVDYRLQSDGLIPLRAGNWWEYRQDTATVRRSVTAFALLGGEDYYLLCDSAAADSAGSNCHYLRNNPGGVTWADFPADSSFHLDTLFKYPDIRVTDSYYFRDDSMQFTASGTTIRIGDSTFTHVVIYQRFLNHDPDNSIKYYLVPHRIGIVREEEFVNRQLVLQRNLVNYRVLN